MENILSQIVVGQKATKKALTEQTKVLNEILKVEKARAGMDKRKLNEEKRAARDAKKKASDREGPKSFMKNLKKDMDRDKGGIFGGLFGKGLMGKLAGFLKSVAVVGAIVGVIGAAVYKYVTSKEFRDAINNAFASMWTFAKDRLLVPAWEWIKKKGPEFGSWLQTNVLSPAWEWIKKKTPEITQWLQKSIVDPLLQYMMKGLKGMFGNEQTNKPGEIIENTYNDNLTEFLTGRKRTSGEKQLTTKSRQLLEKIDLPVSEGGYRRGSREHENAMRDYEMAMELREMFIQLGNMRAQRDRALTESKKTDEELPLVFQKDQYRQRMARRAAENEQNIEALLNKLNLKRGQMDHLGLKGFGKGGDIYEHRQRGGHINVPGSGSGDKVPMMLPSGSFVMNRNAAAMLQAGGMVPTLLEPGEKVFGPGQWGPMEQMMNSTFGRFQTGGEASVTGTERKGAPDAPSNAIHEYLTKLNDQNIKKVGSRPGRCVEGTLNTMQASGVPNPKATGQDVGNNPRGMIVQTINDFKWKSMGFGSGMTLNSPYGNSSVNVMNRDQWLQQVAAGNIPSGALIFQTKHSNWNGTSSGSSGYDAAIAQQGGRSLWNGQHIGSSEVYNGLQKIIALTPDGKDAGGKAGGINSGLFGSTTGGPMGMLGQVASGVSELTKAMVDTFFSVMGMDQEYGEIKKLMGGAFGGVSNLLSGIMGGGLQMPGAGPGGSTPSAPLTGDSLSKAKAMHDYIVSKGYTSAQAKGIVANIQRESSFDLDAVGDSGSSHGLFQWHAGRAQRMKAAVPDYASNWKAQINYALNEHVGPQYKSATAGMTAKDAAYWWMNKWEIPADRARGGPNHMKMNGFVDSYGFQKGGAVNIGSMNSQPNSNMISKSQEMFAEKIADAVTPVVIPMGGGGGGGGIVQGDGGHDMDMPALTSGDNSIVSMEYKYRITMGASV